MHRDPVVQSKKSGICEGGGHRLWLPSGHLFLLVQDQACVLIPCINITHRVEEKYRHALMSFSDVIQTQRGKTVLSSELVCFEIAGTYALGVYC